MVCMPNTSPAIDNAGTVALINERAKSQGVVNVFVSGAITKGIAGEELARIELNPAAFIAGMVDREASGDPVKLPDGSLVNRIPGFRRWMWDGEFCGAIGFRWQPGTEALPPHCVGHIGYAVIPAKRNRGFATVAVKLTLPLAKAEGLQFVELTTDLDNLASQRTIVKAGGVLHEQFDKPSQFGGKPGLRYRILLL